MEETQATGGVCAAIAAVQGALDVLKTDRTGQEGQRAYPYASLAGIWRELRPLLAEQGLALLYDLEPDASAVRLRVVHPPSGTEHAVRVPLLGMQATMKGLGSAITYARRYALHLAFALAIEGEDEGEGVQPAGKRDARQPAPERQARGRRIRDEQEAREAGTFQPPPANAPRLSDGQVKYLRQQIARRARELDLNPNAIERNLLLRWKLKELEDVTPATMNAAAKAIAEWTPPSGPADELPL